MNKEAQSIIRNLQKNMKRRVFVRQGHISGIGRCGCIQSLYKTRNSDHSLIELLYHIVTRPGFTLEIKEDDFLSGMVENRKFYYRFLLNGLIQHNIYPPGQIAYLKKMPI